MPVVFDIITSLWKADNEATSYLVRQVYTNLRKGLSVRKAVQGAKKTYMTKTTLNVYAKNVFMNEMFVY